ncbi:MAG TPA: hypothetical protein VGL03_11315 [Thermoanaerobaculia bacterium]|jgi:hypothetical protein
MRFGSLDLRIVNGGRFRLDGGAMLGVGKRVHVVSAASAER